MLNTAANLLNAMAERAFGWNYHWNSSWENHVAALIIIIATCIVSIWALKVTHQR